MVTILLISSCLIGLLLMIAVAVGVVVVLVQAGERDTVSTARQDWIQRRSKKDEE